jgi:hypothetical protein
VTEDPDQLKIGMRVRLMPAHLARFHLLIDLVLLTEDAGRGRGLCPVAACGSKLQKSRMQTPTPLRVEIARPNRPDRDGGEVEQGLRRGRTGMALCPTLCRVLRPLAREVAACGSAL